MSHCKKGSNVRPRLRIASVLLVGIFGLTSFLIGQTKPVASQRALANRVSGQPYALMNANNVTCWVESDGQFPAIVNNAWNGEFPRGSGVGTVYQEGIVFGGKVHDGLYADSIRVTGNTYFNGMQAGAIRTDASGNTIGADDPNDPSVRPFAIRPDMPLSIQYDTTKWPDLKDDAASFFQKNKDSVTAQDIQQIATQYFKDWSEWPAAKGAPWYVDSEKIVCNDAAYDPNNPHDIPGIPEAAKTIWYVCNDENPNVTAQFAGAPPIGIEEQVTLWAYNMTGTYEPLNNVIFKQVKLIYKGNPGAASNSRIDSMFISQWADGNIGYNGDDFGGCDTLLSLGYQYNSTTLDSKYSPLGLVAPAMGFAFLQGTSHFTGTWSDSAIVNFETRRGYRYNNVPPMTAFMLFMDGTSIADPDNAQYVASLQWFNFMRGCLPRPVYPGGVPISSAYRNGIPGSKYVQPGDPFTKTGWYDGIELFPGSRRFIATHGPITLSLCDTAEVIIALVDGIGADNLWSVQVMKYNVGFAKYWLNGMAAPSSAVTSVAPSPIPRTFEVSQNYPNPFNPSTTIRYQIPVAGRVTIKIFNLLGQDVATLIDEVKQPGAYTVTWNASNMPSGVYFYRTGLTSTVGAPLLLTNVRKMILVK